MSGARGHAVEASRRPLVKTATLDRKGTGRRAEPEDSTLSLLAKTSKK
jgi:hypothetical protein